MALLRQLIRSTGVGLVACCLLLVAVPRAAAESPLQQAPRPLRVDRSARPMSDSPEQTVRGQGVREQATRQTLPQDSQVHNTHWNETQRLNTTNVPQTSDAPHMLPTATQKSATGGVAASHQNTPPAAANVSQQASAEEPVTAGATVPRALPLAKPGSDSRGSRTSGFSPLVSGAASLGLVLALFLMVIWAVRRGVPKNTASLPREAVESLGSMALAGKHQVHLVRCGNKILLLSAGTSGVETLTEISEPAEVERLQGLCQNAEPANRSFRQMLGQFGGPRVLDFHGREQGDEVDFGPYDLTEQRAGIEPRELGGPRTGGAAKLR